MRIETVDIVYLDFDKAFNAVSCKFVTGKLRYKLDKQTMVSWKLGERLDPEGQ